MFAAPLYIVMLRAIVVINSTHANSATTQNETTNAGILLLTLSLCWGTLIPGDSLGRFYLLAVQEPAQIPQAQAPLKNVQIHKPFFRVTHFSDSDPQINLKMC